MSELSIKVNPRSSNTIFNDNISNPSNTPKVGDLVEIYRRMGFPEYQIYNDIIFWENNSDYAEIVSNSIAHIVSNHSDKIKEFIDVEANGLVVNQVNYGLLAHVFACNLTKDDEIMRSLPDFYAIASRFRRGINDISAFELNIYDAVGLSWLESELIKFKKFPKVTDFRSPTVRNLGFFVNEDISVILNQRAGFVSIGDYVDSVEVNVEIYEIHGKSVLVFEPNTASLENPSENKFQRELAVANNIFIGEFFKDSLKQGNAIAAGYIAALAEVWLLTGKVPQLFEPNAGDGVLLASDNKESNVRDVQLITLRGGLSDKTYKYKEFKEWLASLKFSSLSYDTESTNWIRHVPARENSVRGFSDEIIAEGIIYAWRQVFDESIFYDAASLIHNLQESEFSELRYALEGLLIGSGVL